MGYRPNQTPRPAAPRPATPPDKARARVYALVSLLSLVWGVGTITGLLRADVGVVLVAVVGWLIGSQLAKRHPAPALPDPRKVARQLQREQIADELRADRERVAWVLKTNRLEAELGIPLSDYADELADIEARMHVRDALLEKMAADEKADAAPAVPRQAPHPPRPPAGRGASSHAPLGEDARLLFGFPVDRDSGVVVVPPGRAGQVQKWLDRRGYDLRAVTSHPLFIGRAGRPCSHCGLGPHRYEGTHRYDDGASEFDDDGRRLPDQAELRKRLMSVEPVRVLGPGPVVRRLHACSTVDCNGIDSPHCHMSKPCTCMAPGRGWSTCAQHPEISPL